MKKFLKIIFALVVCIVIAILGFTSFVNPNAYRGYMVQQVQEKTGYKLDINGDLRWHIWPQISILANDVAVTAPGAKEMVVKAENMRLNVALMPLFSKQLSIKEIFVKGAIIRLVDNSKAVVSNTTKANPTNNLTQSGHEKGDADANVTKEWALGLDRFEIENSLFIFQKSENKDDLFTVKNINALLVIKSQNQVDLVASSNINHAQQDISVSVKAKADLTQYPKQIAVSLDALTYQLHGASLPAIGIKGVASAQANYAFNSKKFVLTDLKADANGNTIEAEATGVFTDKPQITAQLKVNAGGGVINGDISGTFGNIPDLIIKLTGTTIDADKLVQDFVPTTSLATSTLSEKTAPDTSHALSFLNGINIKLFIDIYSIITNGITINNIIVNADNNSGLLQLKTLSAKLLGGSVSMPGSINTKEKFPFVQLTPKIDNIDLDVINKTFGITPTLSGQLNLNGQASGSGLSYYAVTNGWDADFNAHIHNARLHNFNLQQMIEKAVALSNKDISANEHYDKYSQFRQMSFAGILQKGSLQLNNIVVDSEALAVKGSGTVGLTKMQCDIQLNVNVDKGWKGKQEIIDSLQKTAIPVQIYGPCHNLAYKVDIQKIIKNQLKNEVNKTIDKYLNSNPSSDRTAPAANKILGKIMGKK